MDETAIEPRQGDKRSRDRTATTNAQPLYQAKDEDKLYRLLFGQRGFTPTANMCRLVIDYIAQPDDLSPMLILQKQGHAKQNWYQWQESHPGFLDWWNAVIEDVIRDQHLSGLYLQLLKRARTHDTAAAKLVMQRFDPKYVERSAQDQRHSFAGYEPAAADDSRDRQRKALASTTQSLTGGPDTPALPEPAQAQEQSASAEQTQPEQASKDTIADSKPIKPIEGAGEGV